MLKLQNVSPIIAGRVLFQGLDLKLDIGEVVVIMGRSGIGKTSLFRCVSDVAYPFQGRICREKDFFHVYQDQHQLFPWLTIEENFRLAKCLGKARQICGEWGLDHHWKKKPGMLSVGEKQRFTLTRALCRPEPLLLCDEPLSAVDSITALSLAEDFKSKAHACGKSVLWITHSILEARRVGDRIVILHQDRCCEILPPDLSTEEFHAKI